MRLCGAMAVAFILVAGSAWAQSGPRVDPALSVALREELGTAETYVELGRLADEGNPGAKAIRAGYTALGMGGHGRPADFPAACREWESAASFSAEAAHLTAECYQHGYGGVIDLPRAVTLFEQAGEGGFPKSLCALGNLYATGTGVPTDPARAVALCRQGAELGDADAQTDLGNFYLTGQGVPRDYAEAARWYRRAADQNQPNAAFTLGLMYWNGDGVEKDNNEADRWWRVAYARGREDAALYLGDAALVHATREAGRLDIDALRDAERWYGLAETEIEDPSLRSRAVEQRALTLDLLARYGDRTN